MSGTANYSSYSQAPIKAESDDDFLGVGTPSPATSGLDRSASFTSTASSGQNTPPLSVPAAVAASAKQAQLQAQAQAHAQAHVHGLSGPGSIAAAAAARPQKRRPHTKSRNGCITCKRRRVKCDETRPTCRNCANLRLECRYASNTMLGCQDLQMTNLKLMHHYDQVVSKTIAEAGISNLEIWAHEVPAMAFQFPFLMHAVLMFSATHLAQKEPKVYGSVVVQHRSEALALLRHEVQKVNDENLDALVAASVLFILDAMANASLPTEMTECSLPASTWLHHVRGAATILLAVGVLPPTSKFYSFMGIDLLDLANCAAPHNSQGYSSMQCFAPELAELYPVHLSSPYFASLAFLDKLMSQRYAPDFILRVFSFPALMDGEFVHLLAAGDKWARKIVSVYYDLVRSYCREMHDRVWFLQGVSKVLPIDTDAEFGGLGFVTDALPVTQSVESILARFDASFAAANAESEAIMLSMLDLPSGSVAPGNASGPDSGNNGRGGDGSTSTNSSTNSRGASMVKTEPDSRSPPRTMRSFPSPEDGGSMSPPSMGGVGRMQSGNFPMEFLMPGLMSLPHPPLRSMQSMQVNGGLGDLGGMGIDSGPPGSSYTSQSPQSMGGGLTMSQTAMMPMDLSLSGLGPFESEEPLPPL